LAQHRTHAGPHFWCERAASLLGRFAVDTEGLVELLLLVFEYDAAEIMKRADAHAVLARYAARDVIRHLALLLLDPMHLRPTASK
jgi:hypothetical protein